MKRILVFVSLIVSFAMVPVKADPIGTGVIFGLGLLGRQVTLQTEPHFSFRDGCTVQSVKAEGGGYSYASYDHCKSLPRVYGGKPQA